MSVFVINADVIICKYELLIIYIELYLNTMQNTRNLFEMYYNLLQ